MTKEQTEQLTAMPFSERVKKYLPLRMAGRITQQQYDWILSLGAIPAGDSREDQGGNGGTHEAARGTGEVLRPHATTGAATTQDYLDLFGGRVLGPTTNPDETKGLTQKKRLLNFLADRQWHSTLEIAKQVYGVDHPGVCRIAARIGDLKNDFHEIESEKTNVDSVWKYRLVRFAPIHSTEEAET